MTEDLCPLCQEIVFDDPAIAEFGVCSTCLAKMQEVRAPDDWGEDNCPLKDGCYRIIGGEYFPKEA